jgi:hypothetical protein
VSEDQGTRFGVTDCPKCGFPVVVMDDPDAIYTCAKRLKAKICGTTFKFTPAEDDEADG